MTGRADPLSWASTRYREGYAVLVEKGLERDLASWPRDVRTRSGSPRRLTIVGRTRAGCVWPVAARGRHSPGRASGTPRATTTSPCRSASVGLPPVLNQRTTANSGAAGNAWSPGHCRYHPGRMTIALILTTTSWQHRLATPGENGSGTGLDAGSRRWQRCSGGSTHAC